MAEKPGTPSSEGEPVDDPELEYQEGEDEWDDLDEPDDGGGESDAGDSEEGSDDASDSEHGPESKSYKEIQSSYSKSREELKTIKDELGGLRNALAPYGGIDTVAKAMQVISTDPDFMKLVNQKRAGKGLGGIDEESLTPEQKNAIGLVRKIVKDELGGALSSFEQEKVAPFVNSQLDDRMDKLFDQMDTKYGPQWDDMLDDMGEMTKKWSPGQRANVSLKDVEALYFNALSTKGKLNEFAKKQYEAELTTKKQKSVNRPKSPATAPKVDGKVRNMFDAAKRAENKAKKKF